MRHYIFVFQVLPVCAQEYKRTLSHMVEQVLVGMIGTEFTPHIYPPLTTEPHMITTK